VAPPPAGGSHVNRDSVLILVDIIITASRESILTTLAFVFHTGSGDLIVHHTVMLQLYA